MSATHPLHPPITAMLAFCLAATCWPLKAPRAEAQTLGVALILPGPIDDGGWSQNAYEALRLVERQMGVRVAYVARVPAAASQAHFSRFVSLGYDFIIGHGNEYLEAAKKSADAHPRTKFAIVEGYAGNNRNLGALSFRANETGYLAGVAAAIKSRSGKVAHVGGEPGKNPSLAQSFFTRGARATRPEVQVRTAFVGNWTDAAKAHHLVSAMADWGADVVSLDADVATVGGSRAADERGLSLISWNLSRSQTAPRNLYANVVQRFDVVLLDAVRLVQMHRFEGKQYNYGLREGAQDLFVQSGWLTPPQAQVLDQVRRDIRLGRLDLSRPAPTRASGTGGGPAAEAGGVAWAP